jgi:hypothetical protein
MKSEYPTLPMTVGIFSNPGACVVMRQGGGFVAWAVGLGERGDA